MRKTLYLIFIFITSFLLVSCVNNNTKVEAVFNELKSLYLNNQDSNQIVNDLNLLNKSNIYKEADIKWMSSKTDYLTNEGKVNRAEYGNINLNLTLTITIKKIEKKEIFNLIIIGYKSLDYTDDELITKINQTKFNENEVIKSSSDLQLTTTITQSGFTIESKIIFKSTSISKVQVYYLRNTLVVETMGIPLQQSSMTLYNPNDGNLYGDFLGLDSYNIPNGNYIINESDEGIDQEMQTSLLSMINFKSVLTDEQTIDFVVRNSNYELSYKDGLIKINFKVNMEVLKSLLNITDEPEINGINLDMLENVICNFTINIKDDVFEGVNMELSSDILLEGEKAKLTDHTTTSYLNNYMPEFPSFDNYKPLELTKEDTNNE